MKKKVVKTVGKFSLNKVIILEFKELKTINGGNAYAIPPVKIIQTDRLF